MKAFGLALAASFLVIGAANAQTSTLATSSGAMAVAGPTTFVVPPAVAGSAGGGGIGNATWVMGQSTGGNNVTSYDACLKNAQLTVLFAAVAIPLEISHCWELRDMEAMAKFPPGSIQYEHGCRDSAWRQTDWDTGTMKCTANVKALAKLNPNDPRARPTQAVAVVMPGMSATGGAPVPGAPPPTIVPVSATDAPATGVPSALHSRRCNTRLGIVDQCTG